jgi:hypothetical protein
MEQWLPILDWPEYSVSNLGRVRSARQILKPSKSNGYLQVKLCRPGLQQIKNVHRLVCIAFNGPPPFPGAIVRHSPDNSKENCNADNLKWGTHKQNGQEKAEAKTTAGENNGNARLDWDKVRQIRAAAQKGIATKKELAKQYNVAYGTIIYITTGRTWKE